jgi:hypothetical protein
MMSIDDSRTENELAAAEHRYGRCDVCEWVLMLDLATREVYCPAGELHPGFPVRFPVPAISPGN